MKVKYYLYKYKYEGHCTLISGSYNAKSKTVDIELDPEQERYINSLLEVPVDYGFYSRVAYRHFNKVPRSYDQDNHTVKILVPKHKVASVQKHSQQYKTKSYYANREKYVRRKREWRMHHFYFGMHNIVDQTRRAYLIQLPNQQKFWFPKSMVKENDKYYAGVILEKMTLKDAETDRNINVKQVWRQLGSQKKAVHYGGVLNEKETTHIPPKLKPKKVTIDDRLKR